jgi:predicted Rossmann fold flavoprotein
MTGQEKGRVVIIGGGASGMMAAIVAARQRGAVVTIIERMSRVGKKLLATGNGRCNLTNTNLAVDNYHGGNPQFVKDPIDQFDVGQTISFFENLGIEPCIEEDGRVYPASGQASSVLDVLRYEMGQLSVEVICDARISRVEKRNESFLCLCADSRSFPADSVIVATGGKSSPNLGSNGSGFKIAEELGHTVKTPFPALVPVTLDSPFLKRLSGIRIQGRIELCVDNAVRGSERGELLFTDYGISGIPVMQLSRTVSEYAKTDRKTSLHLDLFPDSTHPDLARLIAGRIARNREKTLEMSFVGLIHKRLIAAILQEAGFENVHSACGELPQKEIHRIAGLMKDWPLRCTGVTSWMFSQVTAGGVDVEEVNPRTMESKIVPCVYFAGEVLDVDGDCGGYNLQWAWSSGFVAGMNAALKAAS